MGGDLGIQCLCTIYAMAIIGFVTGGGILVATYSPWRFWFESVCTVTSSGVRYRCSCGKNSCHDCLDVYYSAKVIASGAVYPNSMETILSPFPNRTIGMSLGCLSDGIGKNCTTTVSTVSEATYYYNVGVGLLIAFGVLLSPIFFAILYIFCCESDSCGLKHCSLDCCDCSDLDCCECQEAMTQWKESRRQRREMRRREREERRARRNGNHTESNNPNNNNNNGSGDSNSYTNGNTNDPYNVTPPNSTGYTNTYNYYSPDPANPNNPIDIGMRNIADPATDTIYAKVLGEESARRQDPNAIVEAIPIVENSGATGATGTNQPPLASATNTQQNPNSSSATLPPVASITLT